MFGVECCGLVRNGPGGDNWGNSSAPGISSSSRSAWACSRGHGGAPRQLADTREGFFKPLLMSYLLIFYWPERVTRPSPEPGSEGDYTNYRAKDIETERQVIQPVYHSRLDQMEIYFSYV